MPDLTRETVDQLLALGAVELTTYSATDTDLPDVLAAVVPEGYRLATEDLAHVLAPLRDAPRRITGDVSVTDTSSFLAYYDKHAGPSAELFGDVRASTVTAILNAPDKDVPQFGDHRLTLNLTHSPAWTTWASSNGQLLSQAKFAELIEARTPDLVEPDAATMLEVAQTIKATTNVKFESGTRLHDGQRRFTYAETMESKAGSRGEFDVPTELKLNLQVWRGVDIAVAVTARFRFRVQADGLALGYSLDRLEDVLDEAWKELLKDIEKAIPNPVLAGRAPHYGGR